MHVRVTDANGKMNIQELGHWYYWIIGITVIYI